jgi:hypothetical protein
MQQQMLLSVVATTLLLTAPRPSFGQSEDGFARAGYPHLLSRYAQPSFDQNNIIYYIGGGAKFGRGEPRRADEGTFGLDYQPIVPGFRRAVVLDWWHGRREQGGAGQYEPNERVRAFPEHRRWRDRWD